MARETRTANQDQVCRTLRTRLTGSAVIAVMLAMVMTAVGLSMAFADPGESTADGSKLEDSPAPVRASAAPANELVSSGRAPTEPVSAEDGACCSGVPVPCPADLNNDNEVDALDLLVLLAAWGPCSDPNDCPADLNDDNEVDALDLLILLGAWGACPDGGSCDVTSLEACEGLDGYFLGKGTTCDECPMPIECPDGAIMENEPCGQATTNGCNIDPPGYGPTLTCGDTVCGTAWAEGGQRDDDWYRITLAEDTSVSWSVEAPYPVEVRLLTDACPPILVATSAGQNPTVDACLPAGEYVLAVRPTEHSGLSCGSELNGYVADVSCQPCTAPTGACCTDDGGCEEMPALTCFSLEKESEYMGNGSTCSGVDCPFGPPPDLCKNNCGATFVDDTMGSFCHCNEDFCEFDMDLCCPGVCDHCPDLHICDPTFICGEATGACCESNPTPGCGDQSCCEAVCSCDPFCCDAAWDPICAEGATCSAAQLCPQCSQPSCPTVNCNDSEGEPCGEAINDGCSASETNPPYGTIQCGQSVCGNLWAAVSPENPSGARDEDWYLLDLTGAEDTVEITWSVEASHAVSLFVLSTECPAQIIEGPTSGCDGSITLCLEPGEYVLFVAPTVFEGLPCPGFTYEATLTCDAEICNPGFCIGLCGAGYGVPGCEFTGTCDCYCDDTCASFGDCCPGICDDCPHCAGCPGGTGCN